MNGEPAAETIRSRAVPGRPGVAGLVAELLVKAGWPPCIVFAAHVLLYSVVRLYDRVPRLDLAMHFAGGIAIASFFAASLAILRRRGIVGPVDAAALALLVLSLTVTAAVAWEFGEYGLDVWLGTRLQVDLDDTLSDLALGALGGGAFLLLGRMSRVRPAPPG